MKEFQALGLDVGIQTDNGELLDLKEVEEAEYKEDARPADEVISDDFNTPTTDEEEEEISEDEFEEEDDIFEEEVVMEGDED